MITKAVDILFIEDNNTMRKTDTFIDTPNGIKSLKGDARTEDFLKRKGVKEVSEIINNLRGSYISISDVYDYELKGEK